jgi:drug/metabolite transporter (DMT)-like permease
MNKYKAGILLIITTFFWGVTFTIVKDAIRQVDVFVFLAQRFLFAAGVMLPLAVVHKRTVSPVVLRQGVILGLFLFASYAFQTVALLYTTASNTGFLTGLNVVIVPLLGALVFHHPVSRSVWMAVVLSIVGLFLLCTNGSLAFNRGDVLAAVCAVCVSLHLLYTSRFARQSSDDVIWLTTLQLGTVAGLSSAAAQMRGMPVFDWHPELLWTLIVCSLIATVFAFLVQTSMQRYISPAQTALIFCSEPVFAALYAYVAAGERLGLFGMIGALLILAGMLISELPTRETAAHAPELSPDIRGSVRVAEVE